ncbi:MAG: HAD-IIA family hydrolase [Pseudomonadota bacterium]
MTCLTTAEAFAAYEAARARMPEAAIGKPAPRYIRSLEEIADQFDVFLLDAFGVLNIGETAISGVPERVRDLKAAGKRVFVLSNAASVPREALLTKYRHLGYDFEDKDVITSRMAAIAGMKSAPDLRWGVMGLAEVSMTDFGPMDWQLLGDDPEPYESAEGFLLVGSGDWSEQRQALLERSLKNTPRPVRIANPDIIAPRERGFTTEPGYFAHRIAQHTDAELEFFGKPFPSIYTLAFERLGATDRSRIVMVGDSLHTDVLGAQSAGISSVLISDFGFFAGQDTAKAIRRSGIIPDFIAPRP